MKRKIAVPSLQFKPLLSLLLCVALVFGLVTSFAYTKVEAKSSRLAVIKEMNGEVKVQSAGGSKAYDAYSGMNLNQGDYLKVGSGNDTYVMLEVKDTGDQLTFGEGSEVYISKLAGGSDGKQSKLQMWAGSMWAKVKKLAGADTFEIETPTAVMGVQGTLFFTSVSPDNGQTYTSVAAGVVEAATVTNGATNSGGNQNGTGEQTNQSTTIYPSQQFTAQNRDEVHGINVSIVDPAQFVKNASSKILEMMVANKDSIDKENKEFIDKQKENLQNGTQQTNTSLVIKTAEELQKVQKNLDNIVGIVIKTAIEENKVDKKGIEKIIDSINKNIEDPNKRLDLNKVENIDRTAGVDPELEKKRQEEFQKQEEEKKKKEEQDRLIQQMIKEQLVDLLKKADSEQKRIEEENRKAKEEADKKATVDYLKTLPKADQDRFQQDQQQQVNTPVSTAAPTVVTPADTDPPAKPIVELFSKPVNTSTPTLIVQAETSSTITVMDDTIEVGRAFAQSGKTNVKLKTLSDGAHNLSLYAADSSQNRSQPASVTVIIDTTKPAAPLVESFNTPVNTPRPTLKVQAELGAVITVMEGTTEVGGSVAQTGSINVQLTRSLTDGSHSLTVSATDPAGNTSDPAVVPVIIDTKKPDTPVVEQFSTPVNTPSPTIKVQAELGSVIKVLEGSLEVGRSVAISASTNVQLSAALKEGTHTLTVFASDSAGNISDPASVVVVIAAGMPVSSSVKISIQPAGPSALPTGKQVVISMENFTQPFYGVEVHLRHNSNTHLNGNPIHNSGDIFVPGDHVIEHVGPPANGSRNETIYTVMNYNTLDSIPGVSNQVLITLPFYIEESDTIELAYVMVVNKDGVTLPHVLY